MRYRILVALIALAASTAASAQDATFTGARVEGLIGYESADIGGEGNTGVLYGAAIGYDVRAGSALVGGEAEYTLSEARECTANYGGSAGTLCTDLGRDFYLGGRVGTRLGSAVLVYAKAGYTNARLETEFSSGVVGAGVSRRMTLDGFRLGAGGEFALGSNSYLKTEYRYSSYGQDDNDFVGGTALQPVFLAGDRISRHQVVGGFGLRF